MNRSVQIASVALLLLSCVVVAPAAGGDKDKNPLDGVWNAMEGSEGFTLTVTGAKWVLKGTRKGVEHFFSGNLKVDTKQNPKTMDLEVVEGSEMVTNYKGKTALGIFALDGNKLQWCVNEPGREGRPKEFSKDGVGGDKYLYLTFQREKK